MLLLESHLIPGLYVFTYRLAILRFGTRIEVNFLGLLLEESTASQIKSGNLFLMVQNG